MAYVYVPAACAVHVHVGVTIFSTGRACAVHVHVGVTIFSTGGKFQPVSNFRELDAHTQVAHSYAL